LNIGIGHIFGSTDKNIVITCDGVHGCSEAYISNRNKVFAYELRKQIMINKDNQVMEVILKFY